MTVTVLFVVAAAVIRLCAEPFANSLIQAGTELGIDQFLLVQWLAPLSSEAPELIIAVLFALRGKGTAAIAILISSKVNQWILLVGSLPLAYLAGGGGTALVLDGRQTEEMLLTAAQTMMGVAVLLALRFPRWAAWTLLALFGVQFPLTDTTGRLVLAGIYLVLAAAALVRHRQMIIPTLLAPFRPSTSSQSTSEHAPGLGRMTSRSGPASDSAVPMTSTLRSQPGTAGQGRSSHRGDHRTCGDTRSRSCTTRGTRSCCWPGSRAWEKHAAASSVRHHRHRDTTDTQPRWGSRAGLRTGPQPLPAPPAVAALPAVAAFGSSPSIRTYPYRDALPGAAGRP